MWVVLLAATMSAADDPRTELLKVFRGEFVAIRPGEGEFPAEFAMGRAEGGSDNERPVHTVRIVKPYQISKYEVTQDVWQAVMGSNPSRWQGPRNSVEMLSFAEAEDFCRQVTQLLRERQLIRATQVIRLPTEAEWEYAARAGTRTVYSFGDDAGQLGDFGWFTGNAAGNDPPVGAKAANPWGLFDVHGYLWEWCADDAHVSYAAAPADGSAWRTGGDPKRGVLRGGSWKDAPDKLTSSYRSLVPKATRDDAVGLRCVLADE